MRSGFDEAEDILFNQIVPEVNALPTRVEVEQLDRQITVNRFLAVLLAVFIIVFTITWNWPDSRPDTTATAINTGSVQALAQAREDLRAAGVPERELPPMIRIMPSDPVDVGALVDATTATVLARIRTDPAYRGAAGLACDPVVDMRCIGPEGPQGAAGDPGRDSPCVDDPTLCRGDTGEQGPPVASFTIPNPNNDPTNPDDDRLLCVAPTYDCE